MLEGPPSGKEDSSPILALVINQGRGNLPDEMSKLRRLSGKIFSVPPNQCFLLVIKHERRKAGHCRPHWEDGRPQWVCRSSSQKEKLSNYILGQRTRVFGGEAI